MKTDQKVTLGSIVDSFDAKRSPIKGMDRIPGYVPYLGASGVVDYVDGYTHDGNFLCLSEDGENLRSRSNPIAWVQTGKFWANNHLHVFGGVDIRNLRFLSAAIAQSDIRPYLTGSTQPKLTQANALRIEVPAFPSRIRENIGELLGVLDDKIAANQKILRIMDELLRSEFNSLSADSLVTLGEIATEIRDRVEPSDISVASDYVGLEHLDRRMLWLSKSGLGADVVSAKSVFRSGDTLFGKLRPYFHKVSATSSSGVCSTDILVLRANDPNNSPLLLAAAGSDAVVAEAVQSSNGTRMPRAKWVDIASCRIPSPEDADVQKFNECGRRFMDRATSIKAENQKLAQTRDELLPLLMDGRITVKDAERVVEEEV